MATPRGSWLWRVGGSAVTALVLAMGLVQVVVQLGHEEYSLAETYDAAGLAAVEIGSQSGVVRVVGGDSELNTVTVTAEVSRGVTATRVSHRVEDDRLVLDARCSGLFQNFCRVDYTVEVPERLDVKVRSVGRATVTDVSGAVDVETLGGRVRAERLGGDTRLRSRHGGVSAVHMNTPHLEVDSASSAEVDLAALPEMVHVSSGYGRVEISVPDSGEAYAFDLGSRHGTVTNSELRSDPDSSRQIVARSNGSLTVRHRD